ncbi:DUF2341 domain-containing protein [Desulfobacterota bacterium M19]
MKKGNNALPTMIIALAIILGFALHATNARAWWDENWQYRKKITFDTSDNGAALKHNLKGITLLVRLHNGNFDFSRARANGGDLRFIGASDKTPLKYRTAYYSAIDEMAYLWVMVPSLKADSGQNVVYLYYGNDKAAASPAAEVFDGATVLALPLDKYQGLPVDISKYGNIIQDSNAALGTPAVVGAGVSLFGKEWITVKPSASLNFSKGLTFAAWFRAADFSTKSRLISISEGKSSVVINFENGAIVVSIDGEKMRADPAKPISINEWHYLAVTAGSLKGVIYLDGAPLKTAAFNGSLPGAQALVRIGAGPNDELGFSGDLDEIRLADVARPADWVKAVYADQGPKDKLVRVGPEGGNESAASASVGYLTTIVKNISIDGWLIIGVLGIFSLASWIVLVVKTFNLWMNRRDNKAFLKAFNSDHEMHNCIDDDEEYQNSTLYWVYRMGCRELRPMLFPPQSGDDSAERVPVPLSPRDMAAFRTKLENGFLHENKNLNAWLAILVVAISGGPFLGLLGTVWGVMNTFAAMAAAGEANIMAIAPGVASALSTTVVGLLVAIPASFGYNYLLGNVKEIGTDLAVFIEEFVVHVERRYGADE